MQILKVDPKRPDPEIMDRAARLLQLGGIVAYPTETVYGLGASVMDTAAVQKVFEAKGRPADKPVSIMFRDLEHAEKFAVFNDTARRLAERIMPGPLTIVLKARVPLGEAFGGDRIGVRVSSNPVVREIMSRVKFPITGTSANLSGKSDSVCAKDVVSQMGEKVDLILDSGDCEHGRPSTVIDLSDGELVFVREGAIPRSRIISFSRE